MATIEPIDIKDSVNAIQGYILLIERRIKDQEVIRMGRKILVRLEILKRQVNDIYKDALI